MDYEIFEPDPDDEFYDELCQAAWAKMFNEDWYFEEDDQCTSLCI